MTLPAPFKNHHTVWVRRPRCAPIPLRYALDGDQIVLFGDALGSVPAGTVVAASVHEIAGGPELAGLSATVIDVDPQQVAEQAIYELLDHVPLGRTAEEVQRGFEHHRSTRRLVALVP